MNLFRIHVSNPLIRRESSRWTFGVALILGILCVSMTALPSTADELATMTTRVYPVADLLDIPLNSDPVRATASVPVGGGGMFRVPDKSFRGGGGGGFGGGGVPSPALTTDTDVYAGDLADLLTYHTRSQSVQWDDHGQGGRVSVLGTSLWVTQTAFGHDAVKNLLTILRKTKEDRTSIQIDVRMIELPADQALAIDDAEVEMLQQLAASDKAMILSLRVDNHRSGSVSAGLRRTYIVSATPVVGGNGLETGARSVGYSPQIQTTLLGIFGHLRPMIESDKSRGRIQMSIGLSSGPEEVLKADLGGDLKIDRVEIDLAQLDATVSTVANRWAVAGVTTITDPTSTLAAGAALPHLVTLVRWTEVKSMQQ